jgi:hypothetical protein
MKTVVVEPHRAAYEKEIGSDLESLQHEVGGLIQALYPFKDDVALICNDEGKLHNLPPNRFLYDEEGNAYDIIVGTFLVVGLTEDDFGSLTKKQIETYLEMYPEPSDTEQELIQYLSTKII